MKCIDAEGEGGRPEGTGTRFWELFGAENGRRRRIARESAFEEWAVVVDGAAREGEGEGQSEASCHEYVCYKKSTYETPDSHFLNGSCSV